MSSSNSSMDSAQYTGTLFPTHMNSNLIPRLKSKFREINDLLYTTSVPNEQLEKEVLPYIADDVRFRDPWQEGGDKRLYAIGMKGFHNMMRFRFDTHQVGVQLEHPQPSDADNHAKSAGGGDGENKTKENKRVYALGRCIIDGVMHLQQFSWIYTFPLRTIVVYKFRLLSPPHSTNSPQFEIYSQEEMWSYLELIEGIPGVGWFYRTLFRPAFGHLFVGVSYLSCKIAEGLADEKKKEQ